MHSVVTRKGLATTKMLQSPSANLSFWNENSCRLGAYSGQIPHSLIPCPFFLRHLPAPTVGDRTLSTRADAVHRNQEKKEDASRVLLPLYLLLAQPSGNTRSIVLWSVTRKMKLIQVLQEGSEKRPDQQPNWRTSGIIRNALKLLLSTSSSRD